MSQSLEPIYQPATVGDFKPEWIAQVRAALKRDGQASRAGQMYVKINVTASGYTYTPAPVIEVQSINTGEWMPLNLPANSARFATAADRDAVLELLVGKENK